jgi:prepilin-type N-terminal cleavage/methylation domain-containing protein
MSRKACKSRTVRQSRRGVTLLELLIVLTLVVILLAAVGYGFIAGLDMQRMSAQRQADQESLQAMEQRITRLLQGAKLSDDEGDRTTYFVGETVEVGATGDLGCDRITFTTTAPGVSQAAISSTEDFETQHERFGPQGGMTEVSLSMVATGDAGNRAGLFERTQRPSDGDPTQGGTETLLSERVAQIGFQFWDGTQWVNTWDTEMGERRLPAAVRVSYVFRGEERASEPNAPAGGIRVFVVPLLCSDVDSLNPLAGTGL